MPSDIEWTDETWNPTRGCQRVSPGCEHCYAEKVAYRFSGAGLPYEGLVTLGKQGPRWNGAGRFILDALDKPLHWKAPRKVFVNSMSDLFFDRFSNEQIAAVFGVMAACPQHTFQVLTKRPERAAEWFARNVDHLTECAEAAARATGDSFASLFFQGSAWPLPNVWIGVSVEDQQRADERLPVLVKLPAEVRFVSYEPALGPVDLSPWFHAAETQCPKREDKAHCYHWYDNSGPCCSCGDNTGDLDWVIVGGESGTGARPFNPAWADFAVHQCRAAGVPVFIKQMGSNPTLRSGSGWGPIRDKKGGVMDEWPAQLRVREFPGVRS